MGYEPTHDTVAKLIFSKASIQAQTRRKVERYIQERYQAHRERGARLTQDDLDYIAPYLAQVNIAERESIFLEKARRALQWKRRRRRIAVATAFIVLLAFSMLSLSLWQQAEKQKINAISAREDALDKKNYAEYLARQAETARDDAQRSDSLAQLRAKAAEAARKQAEVSDSLAQLERDRATQQARLAKLAQQAALDSAKVAVKQRRLALVAERVAAENAEIAGRERDKARLQTLQSKAMRVALAARYAMYKGQPSLAFRLAEETLKIQRDSAANRIAKEVLSEIAATPLVRDFEHDETITHVQFSSAGDRILTASLDGTAKWWDLEGKLLQEFRHRAGVIAASLATGDAFLVTATEDHKIKVWALNGQLMAEFEHAGRINSLVISKDNRLLLSASDDASAKVWHISEGRLVRSFLHQGPVSEAVFFYEDRQTEIVTASLDQTAKRWSLEGSVLVNYPNLKKEPFMGVSVAPNQKRVLFRANSGDFLLAPNGKYLRDPTAVYFYRYQPIHSSFSPSLQMERAISFSNDSSQVFVWNFTERDHEFDFRFAPKGKVFFCTFSPSGEVVLFSEGTNETAVFELTEKGFEEPHKNLFRFNARILAGVFSSNGQLFLSMNNSSAAKLWKLENTYIQGKVQLLPAQIIKYYDSRLRPLKFVEREKHQVN